MISNLALLTREQEVELATRVQRMVHLVGLAEQLAEEAGEQGPPTQADWAAAAGLDEEELLAEIRLGREAKAAMITHNLKLVLSLAYRYAGRGTTVSDLVQEGVISLSRAVDKFDPTRGFRFSTYATWWVRQRIAMCAVNPLRLSKVPERMLSLVRRAEAVSYGTTARLGRPATEAELAEELKCTVEDLAAAKRAIRPAYSVDAFAAASRTGQRQTPYSLVRCKQSRPDSFVLRGSLRDALEGVMEDTLSERERAILRMRVGMDDGSGRVKTLREIGERLQLNSRKVRTVEQSAYGKLRRCGSGVRDLEPYLEGLAEN